MSIAIILTKKILTYLVNNYYMLAQITFFMGEKQFKVYWESIILHICKSL